jgi:hypothetical protein
MPRFFQQRWALNVMVNSKSVGRGSGRWRARLSTKCGVDGEGGVDVLDLLVVASDRPVRYVRVLHAPGTTLGAFKGRDDRF